MKGMNPDTVCARYATRKTAISLSRLDRDTMLLEASATGFRMLAELCAAMATASDRGFQIGPKAAGNRFFAKSSRFGIYFNRKR